MRYWKRYVVGVICLLFILIYKVDNPGDSYKEIELFRGANLVDSIWDPFIAKSVNEKEISVDINNSTLTSNQSGIYMDNKQNLMIPIQALRDTFECSSHLYDGNKLVIEKASNKLVFSLNQKEVVMNDKVKNLTTGLEDVNGDFYVPLKTVAEAFGYAYHWDISKNVATADVTDTTQENILPATYDLRQEGRSSVIKDQGLHGTCWAFASLSALESSLLPEEIYNFSPDHMSLNNSFALNQDYGGDYTMSMAYLTAWQGPVLEKDDPYGDNKSDSTLKAVKHVQDVQIIKSKDFTKIKKAVFQYGGVQTSLYCDLKSFKSQSPFYNSKTYGYSYLGKEKPNHDVVIIGWDDNYSKDNFPIDLEGDGAFICQNSWGSEFGDDGVFYVSYYDTNIGIHNVVYTGIENTNNYDNIYQSDLCGWVGQIGYGKDYIYGANVFEASGKQEISAAGFYALGENTAYEVYIASNFKNSDSLKQRKLVAKGTLGNAGYYTIPFENAVSVSAGEKFSVIVKLATPDMDHPLAIEYAADKTTANVDLSDGEGYISLTGENWQNVKDEKNCNLCIKAYTKNE